MYFIEKLKVSFIIILCSCLYSSSLALIPRPIYLRGYKCRLHVGGRVLGVVLDKAAGWMRARLKIVSSWGPLFES